MQFYALKRDLARCLGLTGPRGTAVIIEAVQDGGDRGPSVTFTLAETSLSFRRLARIGIAATLTPAGGKVVRPGEFTADSEQLRQAIAGAKPSAVIGFETDEQSEYLDGAEAVERLSVTLDGMSLPVGGVKSDSYVAPYTLESASDSRQVWDAQRFVAALDTVAFAASNEETRYYLCGVFFERLDRRVALVATDGHRLIRNHTQLEAGPLAQWPSNGTSTGFIMPKETVAWMRRAIGRTVETVTVEFLTDGLKVSGPDFQMDAAYLDATYPDYPRIIPNTGDLDRQTVRFDMGSFAALLQTMKPKEATALHLAAVAKTDTAAEIPGGPDINGHSLCVSARYMADFAATFTAGDAPVCMNYVPGKEHPILFWKQDDSSIEAVLMPRRPPGVAVSGGAS